MPIYCKGCDHYMETVVPHFFLPQKYWLKFLVHQVKQSLEAYVRTLSVLMLRYAWHLKNTYIGNHPLYSPNLGPCNFLFILREDITIQKFSRQCYKPGLTTDTKRRLSIRILQLLKKLWICVLAIVEYIEGLQ